MFEKPVAAAAASAPQLAPSLVHGVPMSLPMSLGQPDPEGGGVVADLAGGAHAANDSASQTSLRMGHINARARHAV
jgi:hypothetical protein